MATQEANQAKIDEIAAQVTAVGVGVEKVRAEVQALKDAYDDGQTLSFAAVDEAVASVGTAVAGVDEINDDVVTPPVDPPVDPPVEPGEETPAT